MRVTLLLTALGVILAVAVWLFLGFEDEHGHVREDSAVPDPGARNAAAMDEKEKTSAERSNLEPAKGSYELRVTIMDARARRPLSDATLEVKHTTSTKGGKTTSLTTGPEGDLRIPGLPPGVYEITASRNGYEASETVTVAFPGDSGVLALALQPAGVLYGVVRNPQGGTPGGLVRLTHIETGKVESIVVQQDGSFFSPSLAKGVWRTEWLPNAGAEPDVRITAELTVAPGRELQVEITAGDSSPEARVGLRVLLDDE